MGRPFYLRKNMIDWDAIAWIEGYVDAREMLEDLYVIKKMSLRAIGKKLGLSGKAVADKVKELGLERTYWRPWRKREKELAFIEQELEKGKTLTEILKELGYAGRFNMSLYKTIKKRGWVKRWKGRKVFWVKENG
ncbi:MAG: hypothetical protein LWW95_08120 [Candidatus Desulfofervidus auxilii]|nr:hypothetical protein [Candidatus Desulfofervidus auxilii]